MNFSALNPGQKVGAALVTLGFGVATLSAGASAFGVVAFQHELSFHASNATPMSINPEEVPYFIDVILYSGYIGGSALATSLVGVITGAASSVCKSEYQQIDDTPAKPAPAAKSAWSLWWS